MDLDRDVYVWVVEHRVPPLDWVFVALTVAGYAGLLWIALAAVLAFRAPRPVLLTTALVAGTVWGADLVTLGLKRLTARERPYETVLEPDPLVRADIGLSFPSGHAATSFAGAVLLAYLFSRLAPALLLLATLVAYSRVYVGVHYPADVLAGAAVGTLVALVVIAVIRLRPRIRTRPAAIRSSAASRLSQIPIERLTAGSKRSGIEISRQMTITVATAPSTAMRRPTGAVGGSSTPMARSARRTMTARPMKKTSLPSVPEFQPVTESVPRRSPEMEYQLMKGDRRSTMPASQASSSPALYRPASAEAGGRRASICVLRGGAVSTERASARRRRGPRSSPRSTGR